MRLKIIILAILIGSSAILPSIAEEIDTTSEQVDTIDSSALVDLNFDDLLGVQVISASKKSQTIREAPASVFIITDDDIRRYGYRNIGEALRRVVGLYITSDRNYEYIGVRGFSRPGDYNTRILTLVNGHRINDAIYDSATGGEDFPVDLESVARIEVVKGPGSALWGTNALLAVVNVITKTGVAAGGARALIESGSHDRTKYFAEYGGMLKGDVEIYASLSDLHSNGQNRIYFPEFDNPESNNGLALGLDDESATRGILSASWGKWKFFFGSGSRYKAIPTASWETLFNQDGTSTIDRRTFTELSYETELPGSDANLSTRLYFDEYAYKGIYMYDYDDETLVENRDYTQSRQWGIEARISKNITDRFSLIAGTEYLKAYKMLQVNYDVEPYEEYVYSSCSLDLRSYYLQTDYKLTPELGLVAGVRLDDYSTFGREWSPRAGLLYSPTHSSMLKLLYGQAFRAPNDYEINYGNPDVYQIGNPNLKPEEIETYELVWEKSLGAHTRLVTSLYWFNLEQIISQITVEDDILQFANLDSVKSKGIEVQIETKLPNSMTGYLGLGLQDTVDSSTKQQVSNSPEFLTSCGVSAPIFGGRFYITPELRYVGNRKTLSGGYSGSETVANLTLSTARSLNGLNLSLSCYNLFGNDYYAPANGEHNLDRIPQDGRTFRFQMSYQF